MLIYIRLPDHISALPYRRLLRIPCLTILTIQQRQNKNDTVGRNTISGSSILNGFSGLPGSWCLKHKRSLDSSDPIPVQPVILLLSDLSLVVMACRDSSSCRVQKSSRCGDITMDM